MRDLTQRLIQHPSWDAMKATFPALDSLTRPQAPEAGIRAAHAILQAHLKDGLRNFWEGPKHLQEFKFMQYSDVKSYQEEVLVVAVIPGCNENSLFLIWVDSCSMLPSAFGSGCLTSQALIIQLSQRS
eukprot:1133376-Pelagomonas_calceolata.AAC.2